METVIFSDLHCDHWAVGIDILDILSVPKDAKLIILAGDLGTWIHGLGADNPIVVRIIAPLNSLGIPVVTVPGNHEYYEDDLLLVDEEIERVSYDFENWYPLQNGQFKVINDEFVVVGATLWTPLAGAHNPVLSKRAMKDMNDRKYIKVGGKALNYKIQVAMYDQHLQSIKDAIALHADKKCIVVTHHAPTPQRIPQRYILDRSNPAYASNAADSVKPYVWISGHIHENFYKEIDGTLHIANPLGYPGEGLNVFEGTYTL